MSLCPHLLLDGGHVAQLRADLAVLDDRVLQLHQAAGNRQVRQAARLLLALRPVQQKILERWQATSFILALCSAHKWVRMPLTLAHTLWRASRHVKHPGNKYRRQCASKQITQSASLWRAGLCHSWAHRMSMSSVLPSLLTASSATAGLMLPA